MNKVIRLSQSVLVSPRRGRHVTHSSSPAATSTDDASYLTAQFIVPADLGNISWFRVNVVAVRLDSYSKAFIILPCICLCGGGGGGGGGIVETNRLTL